MFVSPKHFFIMPLLAVSLTVSAQSAPAPQTRMIIAPDCLVDQLPIHPSRAASANSKSLIKIDKSDLHYLADAKAQRKTICGGFVDVTKAWQTASAEKSIDSASFLNRHITTQRNNLAKQSAASYKIQYQPQVQSIFNELRTQNMMDNLNYLSSFSDRYADSSDGVKAAHWFKDQVESFAAAAQRNDVSAFFIETGGEYQQPSVVVKVGDSNEPGIVIGAHMDTTSSSWSGKKPGADDDGSGSVTVLETARAIINSPLRFKKPIYFVWYAAEEEGLIGSGYVVDAFKSRHIPVDAVMHFDLTGYAHNKESTMWLIDDYVNKDLTSYLETLINTYVKQPVKRTRCGYACSDHASWTQAGYTAAMPAEAAFHDSNPYMHSSQDTTDKLSIDHMNDYLKLAAAFTVEMAEPINK